MKPIVWDIRREGRQWSHEEFDQRLYQAPEKTRIRDWDLRQRPRALDVLGMLLENLGIDSDPIREARRLEGCNRRRGEEIGLREPDLIGALVRPEKDDWLGILSGTRCLWGLVSEKRRR